MKDWRYILKNKISDRKEKDREDKEMNKLKRVKIKLIYKRVHEKKSAWEKERKLHWFKIKNHEDRIVKFIFVLVLYLPIYHICWYIYISDVYVIQALVRMYR